jgi:hypothetical protein
VDFPVPVPGFEDQDLLLSEETNHLYDVFIRHPHIYLLEVVAGVRDHFVLVRQGPEAAEWSSGVITVEHLTDCLQVYVGDSHTLDVGPVLLPMVLAAIGAGSTALDQPTRPVLVVGGTFLPRPQVGAKLLESALVGAGRRQPIDLALKRLDLPSAVLTGECPHVRRRLASLRSLRLYICHGVPFLNFADSTGDTSARGSRRSPPRRFPVRLAPLRVVLARSIVLSGLGRVLEVHRLHRDGALELPEGGQRRPL